MSTMSILSDFSILFILILFIFSLLYCLIKYFKVNSELKKIVNYISDFKKTDLNFRFNEIDSWMNSNTYISSVWAKFRNTFIFFESVALKNGEDVSYEDISDTVNNLQVTASPLSFFNEDALVTSKFNNKIIQSIPVVLVGCGLIFMFFKIGTSFASLSIQGQTPEALSTFMMGMHSSFLVFVVGAALSLTYLLLEKILYGALCKSPLISVQNVISTLFTRISCEKFLYELLREAKIQNNSMENLTGALSSNFKNTINEAVITNLVPYLENITYGINHLNQQLQEINSSRNSQDGIDELF